MFLVTRKICLVSTFFPRIVSAYRDKIVNTDFFASRGHAQRMLVMRNVTTRTFMEKVLPSYTHETDFLAHHERKNYSQLPTDFIIRKAPKSLTFKKSGGHYEISPNVPTFREFALFTAALVLDCDTGVDCEYIDIHLLPATHLCNPCFLAFDAILKVSGCSQTGTCHKQWHSLIL